MAVAAVPFTHTEIDAFDIAALFIQIFGQFFIYGYAYQKEIGTKAVSATAFALSLALSIYIIVDDISLLLEGTDFFSLAIIAASIAISEIFLIPLYFYSFKSEHIWKRAA